MKIRGISSTITTNVTYTDTESQTWTRILWRESNGFQDLRSWLSPKLLTCNHPSFHIRVADFPRCIENRNNCTVISIRNIYYSMYIMNLFHNFMILSLCKKKKKKYHTTLQILISQLHTISKISKSSWKTTQNWKETRIKQEIKKKKNSRYLSALLHKFSYINFIHSLVV